MVAVAYHVTVAALYCFAVMRLHEVASAATVPLGQAPALVLPTVLTVRAVSPINPTVPPR